MLAGTPVTAESSGGNGGYSTHRGRDLRGQRGVSKGRRNDGKRALAFAFMTWVRTLESRLESRAGETGDIA